MAEYLRTASLIKDTRTGHFEQQDLRVYATAHLLCVMKLFERVLQLAGKAPPPAEGAGLRIRCGATFLSSVSASTTAAMMIDMSC